MVVAFADLVKEAKTHIAIQLLNTKRCFGGHATIGIVVSAGETKRYGTMRELADDGHIPSGLDWMDKFLPHIPAISKAPCDDSKLMLSENGYQWDGPECPWMTAENERKAAAERARQKREKAKREIMRKEQKLLEAAISAVHYVGAANYPERERRAAHWLNLVFSERPHGRLDCDKCNGTGIQTDTNVPCGCMVIKRNRDNDR